MPFALQLAATVGLVWLMDQRELENAGPTWSCKPLLTVTQTRLLALFEMTNVPSVFRFRNFGRCVGKERLLVK
ncbi:hypothetical protein SESBI_33877 [Sesbania bispinosa]|nr:hypothetical protein SESBI_33877 [Sesbania bispinosa]